MRRITKIKVSLNATEPTLKKLKQYKESVNACNTPAGAASRLQTSDVAGLFLSKNVYHISLEERLRTIPFPSGSSTTEDSLAFKIYSDMIHLTRFLHLPIV